MNYFIELETKAKKEFSKLSVAAQKLLAAIIDDLSKNPRPIGAKKLVGQEGYRVRQGNFRILYTINDRAKTVRIYRIGDRKDIYR
jgi:mRNA interferase RelE/StbE